MCLGSRLVGLLAPGWGFSHVNQASTLTSPQDTSCVVAAQVLGEVLQPGDRVLVAKGGKGGAGITAPSRVQKQKDLRKELQTAAVSMQYPLACLLNSLPDGVASRGGGACPSHIRSHGQVLCNTSTTVSSLAACCAWQ
eukprot:GHUV01030493.1.p1 GENE.GHUV01030493.1~~GHUV01030493.1.p1  ORF type:complete len:138 (+),score=26.86 GHUV01030493.1:294-707(+)